MKAIEDDQNAFRFLLLNEHRPAGRMSKTTPLTPDVAITHGFRFDGTFDVVGTEIAAVQDAVGLTEVNGFNRFELTGSDALGFLDRMICGTLP